MKNLMNQLKWLNNILEFNKILVYYMKLIIFLKYKFKNEIMKLSK